MKDCNKFVAKNRVALFSFAEKNTEYNADGHAVISRNDPWFNEDEWDAYYNALMANGEDLSSRSMVCFLSKKTKTSLKNSL